MQMITHAACGRTIPAKGELPRPPTPSATAVSQPRSATSLVASLRRPSLPRSIRPRQPIRGLRLESAALVRSRERGLEAHDLVSGWDAKIRQAEPEPQHFLYFRPLPHVHGALRATLVARLGGVEGLAASSASTISIIRSSGNRSPSTVAVAVSRTTARSPASCRSTVRRTLTPALQRLIRFASAASASASSSRPVSR